MINWLNIMKSTFWDLLPYQVPFSNINNTPDVIPFCLVLFCHFLSKYSILFFFRTITTFMYIYRLRVRRIFTSTLPLEACLNTNYCFFLSLSLGFFYMLVIQMRILRINGVNCHKNGHMCVIEVERKITSHFYVNSYIYLFLDKKTYLASARVCMYHSSREYKNQERKRYTPS